MKPAIRVENLSKQYRIGTKARPGSHNLTESILEGASALWRGLTNRTRDGDGADEFWALKDVSFEVQPGEVVGIIGRNGAGKSTLLKILSQITEPTSGRAVVRGRMASLLEVGTGFHPELTGRENIYLNGSILGMSQHEIHRKFGEIVAFAEIEQFLDLPVKRYSSGMYVRLAFAVAAHLETEVLIVDEVLAVGDAMFQRRCLDRMGELAASGRTVLFVSHNMHVIPRLCRTALLLERGQVASVGRATEVSRHYHQELLVPEGDDSISGKRWPGDGRARFTRMRVLNPLGAATLAHTSGEDIAVQMEIESTCDIHEIALAVVLQTLHGFRVITSWTREVNHKVELRKGRQAYECRFRNVKLRPGLRLQVGLWMAEQDIIDAIDSRQVIEILASDETRWLSTSPDQGAASCDYTWSELGISALCETSRSRTDIHLTAEGP